MAKRKLLASFLLLMATGCATDPVSRKSTNNPAVSVDLLFENDGCKVYRFNDNGYFLYYAKCQNAQVTTMWNQTHVYGKTVTSNPVEIPTKEQIEKLSWLCKGE